MCKNCPTFMKPILKIDTREQKPLTFNKLHWHEIRRVGLPFGDYGCEIYNKKKNVWEVAPLVFERKSLGDLYGTLTKGHERFKKELSRAREAGSTLILIIEASYREVGSGYKHSRYPGTAMLRQLATLYVKHGLIIHFFNDRKESARFIKETFEAIERNWKHE